MPILPRSRRRRRDPDCLPVFEVARRQHRASHVVTILGETFGIKRLLVEGGGRINGSFLRAGMIDEISLLLAPALDGLIGVPSVFDYEEDDAMPNRLALSLTACERKDGGIVWLRYDVARR